MCDFHGFYIDMCLITGWYSKGGKHVAHITGHMGCKTQLRMDISSLRTTRLVNIRGTLEEVNHTKLYRCVDIHPLNFPYANRICDHIIIDYKFNCTCFFSSGVHCQLIRKRLGCFCFDLRTDLCVLDNLF